jgi:hypothetical protein
MSERVLAGDPPPEVLRLGPDLEADKTIRFWGGCRTPFKASVLGSSLKHLHNLGMGGVDFSFWEGHQCVQCPLVGAQ